MPLNASQQAAVDFGRGPAMVLAGPGSGKTAVITCRVRKLVEDRGVAPSSILVITFTRAAADEMRVRYEKLSHQAGGPVVFGTFHSVFFNILRNVYNYNASQIIRQDQKKDIVRQLLRDENSETEDENELISALLAEIGAVKGEGADPRGHSSSCCPDDLFLRIYEGYQGQLRSKRLIDFDDMLVQCRDLFVKRPDVLRYWQGRFRFILIDEFQDINRLQYDIMRMLAQPENNLFVVGDDDQSIYRFRGARPDIMLHFTQDFPDATVMQLDVNYRSTPEILAASRQLIGVNKARYRKSSAAAAASGPPPVCMAFDIPGDEYMQVLRDMAAYHEKGVPFSEMAVLFRTNNDPRSFAETLMRMNFPFKMKDVVPNLYEHWVSQDVLTYMMIAAGSRRRGDFLRVMNRPKRYIRRADLTGEEVSFDALIRIYSGKPWMVERIDQFESDINMLSRLEPFAAVNFIRKGIGYEDFLREYARFRRIRPDELIEVMDELQEASKPFRSLSEWLGHIREYTQELAEKRRSTDDRDAVCISTMHGAKGMEYEAVFIVDANEGVTPHRRAEQPEEIEEERRLFYVAMTRAKRYLHIYWTHQRYGKDAQVSRFVREMLPRKSRK